QPARAHRCAPRRAIRDEEWAGLQTRRRDDAWRVLPRRSGERVERAMTALPLVVVLFIGSGCAALIYEIVWFQMLELIVGSSAVSLGVVLGTFMGGMCLGSLAATRYIASRHHPLRVYAVLEAAIGLCGLLILLVLPHAGGLFSAICLLPPTILMGATLPAVARWVEATPRGASWLGFFYGGNVAGAVA